jgi:hypothetical protein
VKCNRYPLDRLLSYFAYERIGRFDGDGVVVGTTFILTDRLDDRERGLLSAWLSARDPRACLTSCHYRYAPELVYDVVFLPEDAEDDLEAELFWHTCSAA